MRSTNGSWLMSSNVTKIDDHFKTVAEMELCGTAKLIALAIRLTGSISVDELMDLTGESRRVVQLYRAQYISAVDGDIPAPRESCERRETGFVKDAKNVSSSCARVEDNNITNYLEPTVVEVKCSEVLLRADAPKPKREAQGTRLDREWSLPESWRTWSRTTFPQTTAERVTTEAETFRDYWISAPGQRGRKADWEATWRNWCRKAFATGPLRPNAQPPPMSAAAARTARMRAILREGSPA